MNFGFKSRMSESVIVIGVIIVIIILEKFTLLLGTRLITSNITAGQAEYTMRSDMAVLY